MLVKKHVRLILALLSVFSVLFLEHQFFYNLRCRGMPLSALVLGILIIACSYLWDRRAESNDNLIYKDQLTGVYNRNYFESKVKAQVRNALGRKQPVAVAYIDVDDLKIANDYGGYEIGNRILIGLSKKWTECLRPRDVLCRTGGDEFVLVMFSLMTKYEVEALLRRIVDLTRSGVYDPDFVDPDAETDTVINTTCSIGASISFGDKSLEELLSEAELALKVAKGYMSDNDLCCCKDCFVFQS